MFKYKQNAQFSFCATRMVFEKSPEGQGKDLADKQKTLSLDNDMGEKAQADGGKMVKSADNNLKSFNDDAEKVEKVKEGIRRKALEDKFQRLVREKVGKEIPHYKKLEDRQTVYNQILRILLGNSTKKELEEAGMYKSADGGTDNPTVIVYPSTTHPISFFINQEGTPIVGYIPGDAT